MIAIQNAKPEEVEEAHKLFSLLFPSYTMTLHSFQSLLFCFPCRFAPRMLVAWYGNQMVGLAFGAGCEGCMYIQAIGVLPAYRQKGIGHALLARLTQGYGSARFSGTPFHYLVPGLDRELYPEGYAFFLHEGFGTEALAYAMRRGVEDCDTLPAGVVAMEETHFPSVLGICELCGHPTWKESVVMGHVAGLKGVVFLTDGKVAGFSLYGFAEPDMCRFGPIGVYPAYRGRGIGHALVKGSLCMQKKSGCKYSFFLWGEEGSPAVGMYRRLGFQCYSTQEILVRTEQIHTS